MQSKRTDEEIIQAILKGETTAFAELVHKHKNFVFTLCLRFSKNREDAEEIAQDAFIKMFKYVKDFKQQSKFTTWLYRIVYTTAMTYLRKKKLATSSLDDDVNSFYLETNYFSLDGIDMEKKSRNFYINKAIEQLLPDDATMINLFYLAEQSLEEIAIVMGLEANTVKVKLFRARQRLKDKLNLLLKHEAKDLI